MTGPTAELEQACAWYAPLRGTDPARFLEAPRETCPWCGSANTYRVLLRKASR